MIGLTPSNPTHNEKLPGDAGLTQLEKLLRLGDLKTIEGKKIAREEGKALGVVTDIQEDEDGAAPTAKRLDRSQLGEQDMVRVILQALELRSTGGLNGAQTSAALMASDFLLKELNGIAGH